MTVQPHSSHFGLSFYNNQGVDSPTSQRQQQFSSMQWPNKAPIVCFVFGFDTASSMSKLIFQGTLSDPDVSDAGKETGEDKEPAKSRNSSSDSEGQQPPSK